ncbi:hypothetical protein GO755_34345 [Spirosoma sp. HMF4905]|uniref:Nucleotide exchange factor GrpE n=1 Tax=Spirosoma arboris TaxID=2682092 RepID=A0A7K1SMX8_9BACT|nr:hypothetical protein [Spirosoma arboris]MVM35155.1 hypothetical protein [Spirosoma arboris]
MRPLVDIANQVHILEKKAEKDKLSGNTYSRPLQRIRQALLELGISYHSPDGEPYSETRTDVEASVTGDLTDNLVITQVIKPIVTYNGQIIQTGIVIVESL